MGEWITVAVSVFAFIFYDVYLRWLGARTPMKTARSAHAAIRSAWVKSVMSRPGTELLVIQTLRNSVMAASFMATTAVLAVSATFTLTGVGNTEHTWWHTVQAANAASALLVTKLALLVGTFFVSFLFLAMAVRFFNHTGYLITGETGAEDAGKRQALAIAYINRAGNYYSFGLRAFFTCAPVLAGLFDTYLMLPATGVLLVVLYWFDRVPGDEQ